MRKIVILGMLLVSGCSRHQQTAEGPAPESYTSPQGVKYDVTRYPGIKADQLPMNSDLKMADKDLAKYAETICTLDVPPSTAADRCDIYVQPDRSGTLIGYAAVTQDKQGVSFQTATDLNEKKEPGGKSCTIAGKLDGSEMNATKTITDASKDFSGQFTYCAWEKDPGNWMISPAADQPLNQTPEEMAANPLGVWYVDKKGNKLHIAQENWNYCYTDTSVNVDDVFYEAVSLTKAPKAKS